MTPEKRVKAKVSAWMKAHKIPAWCIIPSPMGKTTGVSDYIAILPKGIWLAIEVKAEGKKKNLTAHQEAFLDTINMNNGIAVCVDSVDDLVLLENLLKSKGYL